MTDSCKQQDYPWRDPERLRPRVLVSGCLAEFAVRYNGDLVRNRHVQRLLPQLSIVPCCPEMAIGLGTPRPELRLVQSDDGLQLRERKRGIDHTAGMASFSQALVDRIGPLDGAIVKAYSPTCGRGGVKTYKRLDDRQPAQKTVGLFTAHLQSAFPELAIEDEGRLNDQGLRELFQHRIYAAARWRVFLDGDPDPAGLIAFHRDEKLLLMGFDQRRAKALGRLVAAAGTTADFADLVQRYGAIYLSLFAKQPNRGRMVNVLQHAAGYVSKRMQPAERRHTHDCIAAYVEGAVPLAVPTAVVRNAVYRYDAAYLHGQSFWEPWPAALDRV